MVNNKWTQPINLHYPQASQSLRKLERISNHSIITLRMRKANHIKIEMSGARSMQLMLVMQADLDHKVMTIREAFENMLLMASLKDLVMTVL